jgi:hypothetical protein
VADWLEIQAFCDKWSANDGKAEEAFERDLLGAYPELAAEFRTKEGDRFILNAFWARLSAERQFAQPRWTKELARSWIAYRTSSDMGRSAWTGVFHRTSILDPEPDRSLIEAVAKGWVFEFTDDRGVVWYDSKIVRSVFPESGGSGPPPRTKKTSRPQAIADFLA